MLRLFGAALWISVACFQLGCGSVSSADPDANNQGQPDAEEGVVIDADLSPDAEPTPPNTVFVTSSTHTAALGGLAGADTICNSRATEAGLSGTYVAWLSTGAVDAKDRLGSASGWQRVDGRPFASTLESMLAGKIFYPAIIDETGTAVTSGGTTGDVWTGTRPNGLFDANNSDCSAWASANAQSATAGNSKGGFENFTEFDRRACSNTLHLLCFGVDNQGVLPLPSDTGRVGFVSTTRLNGAQGLAAYDTACNADASAAGLSGSFRAVMGNETTAPVGRFSLVGATWVRPDGVKLYNAPGDMSDSNAMLAPIQVRADGELVNDQVWTGSGGGFSSVNPNCIDWSDIGDYGIIGISSLSGPNGAAFNSSDCFNALPFYCFEE